MFELTYIYSVVSRAILLCSVLIAQRCCLLSQPSAEVSRRAHPEQAQPAGANGARAHFELRVLTERLTLTDEQQSRVRSALAEREQQIEELHQAIQNDPNAVGAESDKLRAIRRATDARVAELLSEEQKAGFAVWVDERNAAMERRRHRHEDEAPPARDEVEEPLSLI